MMKISEINLIEAIFFIAAIIFLGITVYAFEFARSLRAQYGPKDPQYRTQILGVFIIALITLACVGFGLNLLLNGAHK